MDSGRLEAFSDGVIAIAITLLVLDLRVPEIDGGVSLATALGRQWPSYLGYVTSFATIGIMWVNHHALFRLLARVDRNVLYLNLALLLGIATLPFTTSLAAKWLRAGDDARLAMVIYCSSMLVIGVGFLALWAYLGRHRELLRDEVPPGTVTRALRRTLFGPAAYAVAGLAALVSPVAAMVVCASVAAYFVRPGQHDGV